MKKLLLPLLLISTAQTQVLINAAQTQALPQILQDWANEITERWNAEDIKEMKKVILKGEEYAQELLNNSDENDETISIPTGIGTSEYSIPKNDFEEECNPKVHFSNETQENLLLNSMYRELKNCKNGFYKGAINRELIAKKCEFDAYRRWQMYRTIKNTIDK